MPTQSPACGVRRPKFDRPDLAVPTPGELTRLIDGATGSVWEVPELIAATTGLRRGEVLGLRWSMIDPKAGRLRVEKSLQRVEDANGSRKLPLVDPKTERSRRSIALMEITATGLRRAKSEQARRRIRCSSAWVDLDLVCDRGDGAPLDPDAFGKATKRLAGVAGLDPRLRLHDLRHGVATAMLEGQVHPAVASAMLGHSSVAFTMDTYQHVIDEMTDQAASALDQAFADAHSHQSPSSVTPTSSCVTNGAIIVGKDVGRSAVDEHCTWLLWQRLIDAAGVAVHEKTALH
jgi:integrase